MKNHPEGITWCNQLVKCLDCNRVHFLDPFDIRSSKHHWTAHPGQKMLRWS